MPSDPYAQYLTPPAGDDPYSKYLSQPGKATAPGATNDYSDSPWSARLRTFQDAATLGMGDKLYSLMSGTPLAEVKGNTAAAESSLPWYERMPIEGAGYALGGGALLGSGLGEAGLGADAIGTVASTALEGAGAGGITAATGTDPSLSNIATGAAGGALLGGAAGGLTKGVNKALTKMTGKAASIDPDQALASTKAANDAAWDAGTKIPVNGAATNNAIASALKGLDPSVQTGMGDQFLGKISQIQGAISDQGKLGNQLNANQVNSWKRQINEAAGPGIEGGVAKSISDNLDGVLDAHGAGQWQQGANEAYQNYMMAQNLGEWGRKAAAGAPLGQAPLTEAEKYYQGKPQYQPLVDLYQKSQSQNDPSWALGHIAAGALGDLGGMMFGFPGHLAMEAAGYLGLKPAIKSMFKGAKQNALGKNIQQLYPQMTGQPLTGASPGVQVGDSIKNLMLGNTY